MFSYLLAGFFTSPSLKTLCSTQEYFDGAKQVEIRMGPDLNYKEGMAAVPDQTDW